MGPRNSKNDEADAYNKAGDQAAKRGDHNTAEMFYDFAAEEQVDADRAATGAGPRRSAR